MKRVGGRAKMLRLLREVKGKISQAFLDFIERRKKRFTVKFMNDLYQAGGITTALEYEISNETAEFVTKEIIPVLKETAFMTYKRFKKEIERKESPQEVPVSFQEHADSFIGIRGAELVVLLSASQKEAIRNVLKYEMQGKLSPYEAQKVIRQTIGLTPKEQQAVLRMLDALVEEGVPRGTIFAQTLKYADQLLKLRAERIERTELAKAYNWSSHETMKDLIRRGLIKEPIRVWETAGDNRVCSVCSGNDGIKVKMEEAFPTGHSMPPIHPNCRCTIVYEIPEEV